MKIKLSDVIIVGGVGAAAGIGAVALSRASAQTLGGSPVQVEVLVADSNGVPLIGASVGLGHLIEVTDPEGAAIFYITPGNYQLTVNLSGYELYQKGVQIGNAFQTLQVKLVKSVIPPPNCYQNSPAAIDITTGMTVGLGWAVESSANLPAPLYVRVGILDSYNQCSSADLLTQTNGFQVNGLLVDPVGAPVCGVPILAVFGNQFVDWTSPDGLLKVQFAFGTSEAGGVSVTGSQGEFGFILSVTATVLQAPNPGQEPDVVWPLNFPQNVTWQVEGNALVRAITQLGISGLLCYKNV